MAQKQTEIPGTERPRIKPLDDAASEYETARNARMEATDEEVDAKDELRKQLHKYEEKLTERDKDGNPFYLYQDDEGEWKQAVLERSQEDVKVRKYKPPKAKKEAAAE